MYTDYTYTPFSAFHVHVRPGLRPVPAACLPVFRWICCGCPPGKMRES